MARSNPATHPNRPTGQGEAFLICNGPSAEGFNAPAEAYSVCLNAGFLAHKKSNGQHVDAAYSVDCPFSIQEVWGAFPGYHVQAEHVMNLRAMEEADPCQELLRHYDSSTFCALDWLRKKGYRKATIVGMDALYGHGHEGLSQRQHIQGCAAMHPQFPEGLYVRDLTGKVHRVTDEYIQGLPVRQLVPPAPGVPAAQRPPRPLRVVAYYTKGTRYEQEAELLRVSLDALGQDHDIQGVENQGTWQKNTQHKAIFIREMLQKHSGPIVYIDVDAVVIQPLTDLGRLDVDFAAFMGGGLHSGTLYFSGAPVCLELVQHWIDLNAKYPDVLPDGRDAWDQRTLELALRELPDLRQQQLGPEYCWMLSTVMYERYKKVTPVIVHTRGAYRLKSGVDNRQDDVVPWVVFPTVDVARATKCCREWQHWGYKVAILIEKARATKSQVESIGADKTIRTADYRGFAWAVNKLCRFVPGDIVVVIGDDITPHPQESGPVLARRFMRLFPDTFGVLQPLGDLWACAATVCQSPWIGRKFIEEAYGGKGPYCEEYFHYFADAELQDVATKLGCFEQDKSIIQYHDHWQRKPDGERPAHLLKAKERWNADKATYERRKTANFPDSSPTPARKKAHP